MSLSLYGLRKDVWKAFNSGIQVLSTSRLLRHGLWCMQPSFALRVQPYRLLFSDPKRINYGLPYWMSMHVDAYITLNAGADFLYMSCLCVINQHHHHHQEWGGTRRQQCGILFTVIMDLRERIQMQELLTYGGRRYFGRLPAALFFPFFSFTQRVHNHERPDTIRSPNEWPTSDYGGGMHECSESGRGTARTAAATSVHGVQPQCQRRIVSTGCYDGFTLQHNGSYNIGHRSFYSSASTKRNATV